MLLVPMPIPQLNGRVRHITQYVPLGPGGAALQTLHWVAGDGHLLKDGLEHRRDVQPRLNHPQLLEVDDVSAHAHPPAEREDEAHDLEGRRVCMTQFNSPQPGL